MDSCNAINICAPAGYGKTSLAVSYFKCRAPKPFRVCWYRLDPEDRNLPVFMNHLTETIFPPETEMFSEARKALEDSEYMNLQPYHTVSMVCNELWSLHNRDGVTRTYIVFDDYQNVARIQEIGDMVRYMIDNLPPSCSIFILSRANHDVITEKQKLEKRYLEIGITDLSFKNPEIKDFIRSMVSTVSEETLPDLIDKSTEGWIAGIIMLCQAFKNNVSDTGSFAPGDLGHEDALFRYLSLEVLKSVNNRTKDSLAKLSLLQDFSEEEASSILEINDIRSLIEDCLAFGMFIQKIPGDPVVYRFHSLFREFLSAILKELYNNEQIAKFHLKAAGYYIGQTSYFRATDHLIKCGNTAEALNMVTKVGFNKFLIGQTAQLKVWLDLLPDIMVLDNPVLLMYKAQLLPNSRQREMVDPLKKLLRQSVIDNQPESYFNTATVLIYIYTISNDMDGLIEMSKDLPWKHEDITGQPGNTLAILDMVGFMAQEQYDLALERSESILYPLLREDSKWLYLILSCIIYTCLGKLDAAERCMRVAEKLDNFKNIEPALGFILFFLSNALSLKNETGFMPSYISKIQAIGEKYEYEYLTANAKRLGAYERYLALDTDASAGMLEYAVFYYLQMGNKVMASLCRLLRRLWTIRHNSHTVGLDELLNDITIINKTNPGMLTYEIALSILGAIARESGDFHLSERCLLSSIESARAKKDVRFSAAHYFT